MKEVVNEQRKEEIGKDKKKKGRKEGVNERGGE